VDDQKVVLFDGEGLVSQPFQQFLPIRRCQDVVQRVLAARPAHASGCREQMDIVIAEDRPGTRSKPANAPEYVQGLRSPISQITDKMQPRSVVS